MKYLQNQIKVITKPPYTLYDIKDILDKQLTDIWEEKNKYHIWLDIELAAAKSMENTW